MLSVLSPVWRLLTYLSCTLCIIVQPRLVCAVKPRSSSSSNSGYKNDSPPQNLPVLSGVKIGQKRFEPMQKCLALSEMCSAPPVPCIFVCIFLALKNGQNGWMDFSSDPVGGSCCICKQLEDSCACSFPSSLQGLLGRRACDSVVSNTESPLPTCAWAI